MNRISLLVPINALPGKGEELKKLLVNLSLKSRMEPGNVCYRPFQIADDKLIIFEQWQEQYALDRHNESNHLKKFFIDSAGIIAGEVDDIILSELC